MNTELEKVIDKYKKGNKNQPYYNFKQCGLPKALNIGLKRVKTKWIARFDSDDICDKIVLEI